MQLTVVVVGRGKSKRIAEPFEIVLLVLHAYTSASVPVLFSMPVVEKEPDCPTLLNCMRTFPLG